MCEAELSKTCAHGARQSLCSKHVTLMVCTPHLQCAKPNCPDPVHMEQGAASAPSVPRWCCAALG
eukprot:1158756-Pelagomonas_calceolata.AAC.21